MRRPPEQPGSNPNLSRRLDLNKLQSTGRTGLDTTRSLRPVTAQTALLRHMSDKLRLYHTKRAGQSAGTTSDTVEIRLANDATSGVSNNDPKRTGSSTQRFSAVPARLRQKRTGVKLSMSDSRLALEAGPARRFTRPAADTVIQTQYNTLHCQTDGFSPPITAIRSSFSTEHLVGSTDSSPSSGSGRGRNSARLE